MRGWLIAIVLVMSMFGASADKAPTGVRKATPYEKEIIELVLKELKRKRDEAPEGKVIRKIIVRNFDVFLPKDGRLIGLLNHLHITTKPYVISRELVFGEGKPWRRIKIEEAERKLRSGLFTTAAVIVPVKTDKPDVIDVLVLTRDVWSIRLNSRWEVQGGELSQLFISFSENNFLGRRKQLAVSFDMNLGEYAVGPEYYDSNLLGSNMTAYLTAAAIWGRKSNEIEGSRSNISIARPFFSLDSNWAWSSSISHRIGYNRSFAGTSLRSYDIPETSAVEDIPFEYKRTTLSMSGALRYGFGEITKQRFSLGYSFGRASNEAPDGLSADQLSAFTRDVLPRAETSSGITASYNLFRNKFHNYLNLDRFGFPEARNLGPNLTISGFFSSRLFGSTRTYASGSMNASYAARFWDSGYAAISAGTSARLQSSGLVDHNVSGSIKVVSPVISFFRIAVRNSWAAQFNEQNNTFYTMGGQSGLRGFPIGAFAGQRRYIGNIELRTQPLRVWVVSAGVLAFYDVGDAANNVSDLRINHNVGVGLRVLIPQLGPIVNRIDWAFPINGPMPGFPGRIVAGVEQVF